MENTDITVLRQLHTWCLDGHGALLATVVRTWGSSPRPPGSMMALRDDGLAVGSVSGGCIEDDLIRRQAGLDADRFSFDAGPTLLRYGVSADEAHRFGLPCGGTLELLIEFNPNADQLGQLIRQLDDGRLVCRSVDLQDGTVKLAAVDIPAAVQFDGTRLAVTLGPAYRMLLIGAGSLSQYLATMAVFSGFDVTLCDPRREYLATWQVPGVNITTEMPDDAVTAFCPDRRSCIVALSHDPKLDDLALLEAVNSPAFYVGAIGSRRNSANRRDRLARHFGASQEALERLHSPVGIFIGSKTPPEIAISTMAEILAAKNGVALPATMQVDHAKTMLRIA